MITYPVALRRVKKMTVGVHGLICFERVLIQTFATQCDGAEAVLLSEGWLLARIMWDAAGRVYERR